MPDVQEPSEDAILGSSADEDDRYAELLLAGFQACAREALRFLLEEEGLAPDHPLPAGLNEHLVRQQCHLAGSLQNDSGIELEESFLDSLTDGSTTACSDAFEGSDLLKETDGVSDMNDHSCEMEDFQRTEMMASDKM